MSSEEFLLKWNDHHNSFFSLLQDLCSTDALCDVTLACGGKIFEAHRIMLCVCSAFFRSLLASNGVVAHRQRHPIIFLKDIEPKHLEQLLQYMYHGEINVMQEDLEPLIEAAKCLQVRGLSDASSPGDDSAPPKAKLPPPLARLPTGLPPPMKKAKILANTLKRKTESPKPSPNSNNLPHFTLPTEPEPPEMVLKEEGEISARPDWTQDDLSNQSEYDISQEMYHESQDADEEQYYQGSQPSTNKARSLLLPTVLGTNSSNTDEAKLRYRCAECGKGFITPSKLQRHSYSHTGQRPFHCNVCGKSFSQSANLKTHLKNTHPELTEDEARALLELNKQMQQAQMQQRMQQQQGGGGAEESEAAEVDL